jgi:hypothetical protein
MITNVGSSDHLGDRKRGQRLRSPADLIRYELVPFVTDLEMRVARVERIRAKGSGPQGADGLSGVERQYATALSDDHLAAELDVAGLCNDIVSDTRGRGWLRRIRATLAAAERIKCGSVALWVLFTILEQLLAALGISPFDAIRLHERDDHDDFITSAGLATFPRRSSCGTLRLPRA